MLPEHSIVRAESTREERTGTRTRPSRPDPCPWLLLLIFCGSTEYGVYSLLVRFLLVRVRVCILGPRERVHLSMWTGCKMDRVCTVRIRAVMLGVSGVLVLWLC